jgi:hypothetical protein
VWTVSGWRGTVYARASSVEREWTVEDSVRAREWGNVSGGQ